MLNYRCMFTKSELPNELHYLQPMGFKSSLKKKNMHFAFFCKLLSLQTTSQMQDQSHGQRISQSNIKSVQTFKPSQNI